MAGLREISNGNRKVVLDLSSQVLAFDLEKIGAFAGRIEIQPTIAKVCSGAFVSAAALSAKAKQFDDGLYAAIEIAAQNGCGSFRGKLDLLQRTAKLVMSRPIGPAATLIAAALSFSKIGVGASREIAAAAEQVVAQFQENELRSKPIGFYRWSDELSTIFRQDRLLQTLLRAGPDTDQLARAIASDPEAAATYGAYLSLTSRLTNPLEGTDLCLALSGGYGEASVFPPSRSPETDLVRRLYGNRPIPEGFDLMQEIVERVRAGSLSLEPREDSGFYDFQIHSLESLIAPERAEESQKTVFDDEYRDHLEEIFKGVYALARETHAKQLAMPMAGSAGPGREPDMLWIAPELSAEPLPTYYARRAAAYRFLRNVLDETFGRAAWGNLRRLTADGPVEMPLGNELDLIERIFDGAATIVRSELGMADMPTSSTAVAAFRSFAASMGSDADLGRDMRMLVPVFFDIPRQKTKAWAFMGWTTRRLDISFSKLPAIVGREEPPLLERLARSFGIGNRSADDIGFKSKSVEIATPVFAETYVEKILDREEFRRHCDRYRTRDEILAHLA